MKKILSTIFIKLICCLAIQAQDSGTTTLLKTDIDIYLSPKIGIEYKLGKKGAIDGQIGINTSCSKADKWYIRLNPSANIGYRYYYNIIKRERKGKNIKGNSANFILTSIGYQHKDITNNEYYITNPYAISWSLLWGIRRTYNKLYIETHLGYENLWYYYKDSHSSRSYARIDFLVGFHLPF
ncbi:MAG: hypothetical protein ACPGSG_11715 [Prolixibacteraceae bacterium]